MTMPRAQRARGRLGLVFRRDGDATRIVEFYQQGCLKARLPRPQTAGIAEAILINLSGGIAGGDDLVADITLRPGASVAVASQAAERVYRALDAPATVATRISLAAGAALDYLPQETILFDGFALRRGLDINLAAGARFLGVEAIIFGRQAMGEVVRAGHLRDRIWLRRDGRLILQDLTRMDGDIAALLRRPAIANGAVALATILYAAPDAAARLDGLCAVLGRESAATLIDGVLFARLLAPDALSLRNSICAALAPLRDGRPLPRVWQS